MKKVYDVLDNALYALEKSKAYVPRDVFQKEFIPVISDIKEITFKKHMRDFRKMSKNKSSEDGIDTIPQELL